MFKTNDIIGMPVLNLELGQECGVIRDVLFDEELRCTGLLMEMKSLFRKSQFISLQDIHAIGEDFITIKSKKVLQSPSEVISCSGTLTGPIAMMGKSVISTSGQFLGQVEDVYFQTEFGHIIGYELSDGLISDIVHGRKTLKHMKSAKIREDAVILPLEDTESIWTKREDM